MLTRRLPAGVSCARSLETSRLRLRRWRAADRAPFAALSADPQVMEFFPFPLSHDESDRMVDRIEEHFERHGFGLWAVEILETGEFAGFVGLSVPRFEAHFTPCVEVAWRLAWKHWGQGYATEGASAALDDGFRVLGLDEIVSFAVAANLRSQRVMARLGMTHDPADDFDHPVLAASPYHRLARHVLYRCRGPEQLFRSPCRPR